MFLRRLTIVACTQPAAEQILLEFDAEHVKRTIYGLVDNIIDAPGAMVRGGHPRHDHRADFRQLGRNPPVAQAERLIATVGPKEGI